MLALVIQVPCATKRSVKDNNRGSDQERNQHVQPHGGEHQSDDGDDSEEAENEAVVDCAVEDDDRRVAEEVEEAPGDEDEKEDNHGDRVPEEAEEEDEEDDDRVVHAEVAQVALYADAGFAQRVGAREGGKRLDELPPWATRREGEARVAGGSGSGGECGVVGC